MDTMDAAINLLLKDIKELKLENRELIKQVTELQDTIDLQKADIENLMEANALLAKEDYDVR